MKTATYQTKSGMGITYGRKINYSAVSAPARQPLPAGRDWLHVTSPGFSSGRRTTLAEVLEATRRASGYPLDAIRGPSRTYAYQRWRMAAIWVAHIYTHSSSGQIGRRLNRDGSTIRHAIDRVRGSMDEFRPQIDAILAGIPGLQSVQ